MMFAELPPNVIGVQLILLVFVKLTVSWVGHACLWTYSLNNLYGRPIPKWFLKPYRLFCGFVIVGYPLAPVLVSQDLGYLYFVVCGLIGGIVFPLITIARLLRPTPTCVLSERTHTIDYWKQLGPAAIGNGKWSWLPRLPGSDVFRVDFTELTLKVPHLPPAWDGLTILVLSDLHFHGTPSRVFFDAVMDTLLAAPVPDLVLLAGDYLDSDTHHEWITPILGRLNATEGKFAILGNHDQHHDPARVRKELTDAGYTVLGNGWQAATIRGETCVMIGQEGPWFVPPPDLSHMPNEGFRLCLSHSPDNFYWGQRHRIGLMVCGHVHGGQIRLPLIGSIFVPSIYSRRFDQGVFDENGTIMAVNRGLSGKEPLRYNCKPQVLRLVLKC